MTEASSNSPFEFETLLKSIDSELTEEQKNKLLAWRSSEIAAESEWERFDINKNKDNALRAQTIIHEFVNSESDIKSMMTELYISLPEPAKAVNRFDYGAEKKRRQKLQEDVTKLQGFISSAYLSNKLNEKKITEYLDKEKQESSNSENAPTIKPVSKDHEQESTSSIEETAVTSKPSKPLQSNETVNVWAFADFLSEARGQAEDAATVDANTIQWISTL